ncbi:MAG: hypothetical protein GXP13_06550 [Gammaproteobacteria bacterium]|nr:hypothetical protein [Gammaproteobacteria bacterium]
MVTIYNMMSGTLRKELDATDQSQSFVTEYELNVPETQLQEIEFDDTATNSIPAHLLSIKAADFLKKMK